MQSRRGIDERRRALVFIAIGVASLVVSVFAAKLIRESFGATQRELPALAPAELSRGNWAIGPLQIAAAWERFRVSGRGVTVGIIDSGIDPTRAPGLAGKVVAYRDFTADGSTTPIDLRGHGTAVAALIAGGGGDIPLGPAPGARLVVARVVPGDSRDVDPAAVDAAIDWMASLDPDGDPATADGPRVINLSIGSDTGIADPAARDRDREVFARSTLEAYRKGIFVVAAAGNAGSAPGAITSPASLAHVFAVGATDSDGNIAEYSARGDDPAADGQPPKPDATAPGTLVGTGGAGTDAASTGTSFSAPLVAGIAALMLEAAPKLQPAEIAAILRSTAVDRGEPGPDAAYGAGSIDAYAALAAVRAPEPIRGTVRAPLLVASSSLARAGNEVTTVVVGRAVPRRGPIRVRIDSGRWSTTAYRPEEVIDIAASGVLLAPLGRGCHQISVRQEVSRGRFSRSLTLPAGSCARR